MARAGSEILTHQINIRVSKHLYERLQKLSLADRRSVSDYCRIALEVYVAGKKVSKM